MQKIKLDIIGKRFERLTVIAYSHFAKRKSWFLCKCDCGKEKVIPRPGLLTGQTRSCGCYWLDHHSQRTHGKYGTKIYRAWCGMLARCSQNTRDFSKYAGRGITVCERWKKFENFYADMGDCPDGLSLDRINNDGNYEPGNCRWATPQMQMRNTRQNRNFELNGKVQCLKAWATEIGCHESTIRQNIKKNPDLSFAEIVEKIKTRPRSAKRAI